MCMSNFVLGHYCICFDIAISCFCCQFGIRYTNFWFSQRIKFEMVMFLLEMYLLFYFVQNTNNVYY